jgi:predicted RNA polymerase sigma factor
MDYYLMQARFAAGAMRDSVVDLVGLVQRLQTAYHVVYQAWQTAQTTLQNPDTQRVQHLIADLDQEALDLLQWVSTALSQPPEVEGVALREVLRSYQRNDG